MKKAIIVYAVSFAAVFGAKTIFSRLVLRDITKKLVGAKETPEYISIYKKQS